jgi:molecular chaperone DnaK
MGSEEKVSIQTSSKQNNAEVSCIGGGIKITASEKPITASFVSNWGKIYILMDCSGSMKREKLDQAKVGITDFTRDALKKHYYVGLIKFSDNADHICDPTSDIESLRKMVQVIRAGGSTNMTDAIKLAHSKLKEFNGTKVLVIATDGMPDNVKSSLVAANNAKADGIEIITIGTDDADLEFLKMVASRTELSSKVSNDKWAQAISKSSLLLMSPKSIVS